MLTYSVFNGTIMTNFCKMSQNLKHWWLSLGLEFHKKKPTNFQSIEVVDRCSETQFEVTENLNWITQSSKG